MNITNLHFVTDRFINAVYVAEDGSEFTVPVIAYALIEGGMPQAMVLAESGGGLELARSDNLLRVEFSPLVHKVHTPIWVEGFITNTVDCPHPNGRQGASFPVDADKLWQVAMSFGEADSLTISAWVRKGMTQTEATAIVLLYHRAGLCDRPVERQRTQWRVGISRDQVIAFTARMTKSPPPPRYSITRT